MTDTQQFVIALLTGAPGGIAALIGIYNSIKINRIRDATNGMQKELIEAAHERGKAAGKAEADSLSAPPNIQEPGSGI